MATALVSTGIQYPDNTIQTSNVTNTLTGVIAIWSGTTANIPSGWALCDGSNSTPDLRDYFVVGAGNSYAVAATGGSANAILVAHTHDATANTNTNHAHVVSHTHTGSSGANGIHTHTGTFSVSPGGLHNHNLSVPTMIGPTHTHPYGPGATNSDGDHIHPSSMSSSGDHSHPVVFGTGTTGGPGSSFFVHGRIPTSPANGTAFPFSPSSDPVQPEVAHSHVYQTPAVGTVNNPHQHQLTLTSPGSLHDHTFTVTVGAPSSPTHTHTPISTPLTDAPNPHGHTTTATLDPATTLDAYSNAGIHTHSITIGDTTESSSSLVNANLPPYYSLAFIMKV